MWSDARARKSGAARSLFIHVCEHEVIALKYDENRTPGKKSANVRAGPPFAGYDDGD